MIDLNSEVQAMIWWMGLPISMFNLTRPGIDNRWLSNPICRISVACTSVT